MTSLLLVAGGVAIILALVLLVARASGAAGRAKSQAETNEDAAARREAFDEEAGRPLRSGRDLVERLRTLSGVSRRSSR